ncbi:related to TAM domain methyltransferase [Cephalotrichum gorgonifer]|uniref:Related to TAM domain methyltransferase n=1 Tax=Cephalotrichum gorgonifer TaxID=2041049 RepID=A0AAE8SSG0_9PEZI|nr:related to TAM domain methyltransferase [Cephalotrichum gorgonifer]
MAGSPKDRTPEPATPIAVDPAFQEEGDDPTLGDETYSDAVSTESITSTIFAYRKLHGRTYHNYKDAEYWGPNDEKQGDGQDLNHHMLYLALDDKLFLAPLENPQKVLDIGAGTGMWAMDMADQFPEAEVIGIDLSPTQPAWVPPNCRFEIDDASLEWTFADSSFDYIHIRFMAGCFEDWVKLYKQCYRCLKPGGYLEHQDFSLVVRSDDGSVPDDSVWSEWASIFGEAGKKAGRTFEVIDDENYAGWMAEAGFADVRTETIKTPLGGWAKDERWKEVGRFNRLGMETSLEGYTLYLLTTVMGWKYEEVQVWLARVREALARKSYHGYTTWGVAYAQKPEEK